MSTGPARHRRVGLPGTQRRLAMPVRFNETALGRSEIQSRSNALLRMALTARTLLLILDASRAGSAWVGLVQGATDTALQALLDAGLIKPAQAQGAVDAGRVAASAPAQALPSTPQASPSPLAHPLSPSSVKASSHAAR